ncbi:MAG: hypothetical protein U1E70_26980 [Acetobacteraceae bacterium]
MRRFFAPLDDALFDRLFQPLTGALRERYGLRRDGVAGFFATAATICWVLARLPGLSAAIDAHDTLGTVARSVILLLGLGALVSFRMMVRRVRAGAANPLRWTMLPHRAIVLLLLATRLIQPSGPLVRDLADVAMLLFAAAALYLSACADPPPVRPARRGLLPAES